MLPLRLAMQHRSAIATALAVALLFAQWFGLAHRVAHAPWQHAHAYSSAFPDEGNDASHSCVAFDAAAIADAIALPPFIAPLLASTKVLALWITFASWDAPAAHHFFSRAPPAA